MRIFNFKKYEIILALLSAFIVVSATGFVLDRVKPKKNIQRLYSVYQSVVKGVTELKDSTDGLPMEEAARVASNEADNEKAYVTGKVDLAARAADSPYYGGHNKSHKVYTFDYFLPSKGETKYITGRRFCERFAEKFDVVDDPRCRDRSLMDAIYFMSNESDVGKQPVPTFKTYDGLSWVISANSICNPYARTKSKRKNTTTQSSESETQSSKFGTKSSESETQSSESETRSSKSETKSSKSKTKNGKSSKKSSKSTKKKKKKKDDVQECIYPKFRKKNPTCLLSREDIAPYICVMVDTNGFPEKSQDSVTNRATSPNNTFLASDTDRYWFYVMFDGKIVIPKPLKGRMGYYLAKQKKKKYKSLKY